MQRNQKRLNAAPKPRLVGDAGNIQRLSEAMPSQAEVAPGEIPAAFNLLDARIDRALKALNELDTRLQPVLGLRTPLSQPDDSDAQSSLALATLVAAARVEQLAERLEELQSALRL